MVGRILRTDQIDEKDILAAKFELEKDEVFHMKNLYEWMHNWLVDHGWEDTDPGGGDKFEHYYWEKRLQGGLREHRVWWRLQKNVADSEYFRFVLLINFRNLASKKVEIVHHGQKVKTWRGDLTLLIEAWLQLDYKNKWEKRWLTRQLDSLYRKRIWKKQMERWKKYLWNEAYNFSGWLKQYLDMKVPFEQPASFHPAGGVGPNPEPPRGGE